MKLKKRPKAFLLGFLAGLLVFFCYQQLLLLHAISHFIAEMSAH